MAHRDVDLVRARLDAIGRAAARLGDQAEDLFLIAHERPSRDEAKVNGGRAGHYLDEHGHPRARKIWNRLADELADIETSLTAYAQATGNLLASGPSAPKTRGSLISAADHTHALAKQRQRRSEGRYTPHRTEEQPRHPGARK